MATSKIKHVTGNGHFDGNNGRLYKFLYTFEDGVAMEANHKTEVCPFKIGDEVEYEVKRNHETYGKSGSVKSPNSGGGYSGGGNKPRGGNQQDDILFQVCLKEAVHMASFDGFNGADTVSDKCTYITNLAYQLASLSKVKIKNLKSK